MASDSKRPWQERAITLWWRGQAILWIGVVLGLGVNSLYNWLTVKQWDVTGTPLGWLLANPAVFILGSMLLIFQTSVSYWANRLASQSHQSSTPEMRPGPTTPQLQAPGGSPAIKPESLTTPDSVGPLSLSQLDPDDFGDPFPPVWNIPYRCPGWFTGRDQVIEQLFANFTREHLYGTVRPQALTGLGGLGKTQTAVAYAYRYRPKYQAVLWIRAETEENLFTSFKATAELLKLPEAALQERKSLLVSLDEWFRTNPQWLIILDSADHLALVEPFLPMLSRGHLLLTSQDTAVGAPRPLPLHPLRPDDGALCILRRANLLDWDVPLSKAEPEQREPAQELSDLMGGLPLALEQAGAYIEATGSSVNEYLELYKKYRPYFQQKYYGNVRSYHEAVAFTWDIARVWVQQENPVGIGLLHLCSFLAPTAIPFEVFTNEVLELNAADPQARPDQRILNESIIRLLARSLITRETIPGTRVSRLSIHPVLQEVLRDKMDETTQRIWAERAVRAVAQALPSVEWPIMQAHARRCLTWIAQWDMSFEEAKRLQQHFAA